VAISVCLTIQLSLLFSPLLTHFSIWLSSPHPSFLLNHSLLIPKLPSLPATWTFHLI
jgi:hypothetical protein